MKTNQAKLNKAFELVNPANHAVTLSEAYGINAQGHWKDEIHCLLLDEDLASACLTIDDVEQAIIHFTATVPSISREAVGSTCFVHFLSPVSGYLVQADGYRKGPAGDH